MTLFTTCGPAESAELIITTPSMLWVKARLRPACLYPWARRLISIASLTRAYLGLVDGACSWPAANRPSWSKMIVVISWRGNNNRQQHFDLMERCYVKPFIIIIIILIVTSICLILSWVITTNVKRCTKHKKHGSIWFAYVVSKTLKTPNLNPMADGSIAWGDIWYISVVVTHMLYSFVSCIFWQPNRYDTVFQTILTNMEFEQKLVLRRAHAKCLAGFIEKMAITVLRHMKVWKQLNISINNKHEHEGRMQLQGIRISSWEAGASLF